MKLNKHLVEKPWGRTDIPDEFGDMGGKRIGEIWYEHDGPDQLPLLVKWLFTSDKLSIQVHPNDTQAKARGQISGKEECWYIVAAEPGAVLGIGTLRPLSSEELRAASLSGEIEQLIDWKPVQAGDYYYIPAGTVHAIGAGITLIEVQQHADITYRLYDYGRPRELHLDDGVAVSVARPYTDSRSGSVKRSCQLVSSCQLVNGPFFRLWQVADRQTAASLPKEGLRWIVPVCGIVHCENEGYSVGDCVLLGAGRDFTIDDGASCLVAEAI